MQTNYTGPEDVTVWLRRTSVVPPQLCPPPRRPGLAAIGLEYRGDTPVLFVRYAAEPVVSTAMRLWFLLPLSEVVSHTTIADGDSVW